MCEQTIKSLEIPRVKLSDGNEMPMVALGTSEVFKILTLI